MTQPSLPGIPSPSRRSTRAETIRECQRIIDALEAAQEARRKAGGTW